MTYSKIMALRLKCEIKHINILCDMRDLGFSGDVDATCSLLEYYADSNDKSVPTFRDNLYVTPKRCKNTGYL